MNFGKGNCAGSVLHISGPIFNSETIKIMRRVLNELCAQHPDLSRPLAREFAAWVLIRLAGLGVSGAAELRHGAERALNGRLGD